MVRDCNNMEHYVTSSSLLLGDSLILLLHRCEHRVDRQPCGKGEGGGGEETRMMRSKLHLEVKWGKEGMKYGNGEGGRKGGEKGWNEEGEDEEHQPVAM